MNTNQIKLPRHRGGEIAFTAHGHRFYVKKITRTDFMMTCPLVSPRARFGNRKQINEDIGYVFDSGALPRSSNPIH